MDYKFGPKIACINPIEKSGKGIQIPTKKAERPTTPKVKTTGRSDTVEFKSPFGHKGETPSDFSSEKRPRENSEQRDTPLPEKKGNEPPNQLELQVIPPERTDLIQKIREEEERLLKKYGVFLRKTKAATIVQQNIYTYSENGTPGTY